MSISHITYQFQGQALQSHGAKFYLHKPKSVLIFWQFEYIGCHEKVLKNCLKN